MKNIIVIFFLFFESCTTSFAQHQLSVTGGWTFSTLYKVGTKEAFETSYYYANLFRFSSIHLPNLNFKYNYHHRSLRFSTGISFLSLGTRDYFWQGTDWAYLYLTVPLLIGHQFKLSNQWSLVTEGGVEIGTSLDKVGSMVSAIHIGKKLPYIGLVLGVESNYKRFVLGIRGHLGVNDFYHFEFNAQQETLYFKHIGGTLYLGYTFWDSKKAKERRERRRNRK
ncbi:MAG: hypothetical protein ACRBFS_26660 [Aureispira sp.]